MKYNTILKIQGFIKKPLVKLVFYLTGTVLMLFRTKAINGHDTILQTILGIIEDDTTISVFTVGLFALGLKYATNWLDSNLEESEKTEADHRKIIKQYNGHGEDAAPGFCAEGAFLKIRRPNLDTAKIHENPVKDTLSGSFESWEKAYEKAKFPRTKADLKHENPDAALTLASVSVYANTEGNPIREIRISDTDERYTLPEYIQLNSQNLLRAHSTTAFKNNETTIRLHDVSFSDNCLQLYTERSTYYEMLMTNRCMDFEHYDHMTLRQIYEYKSRVTKLSASKLGNQIGINGLIITSDGYALVEKRDLSKSTWKNKFSQPISLAMKLVDMKEYVKDGKIAPDAAEAIFRKIVSKTLRDNYGLQYKEDGSGDYTFSVSQNFLGIARDLLEGGKPNLYFGVKLTITAAEVQARMEAQARVAERNGEFKLLGDGKLKSDFYLIDIDHIKVDYDYTMALARKGKAEKRPAWIYINRIQYPRSKRLRCLTKRIGHAAYWRTHKSYRRECSEALLASIAYMQMYKKRGESAK